MRTETTVPSVLTAMSFERSHHERGVEPGHEVADHRLAADVVEHLVERVVQRHEPDHAGGGPPRALEPARGVAQPVGHALQHERGNLTIANLAPAALRGMPPRLVD